MQYFSQVNHLTKVVLGSFSPTDSIVTPVFLVVSVFVLFAFLTAGIVVIITLIIVTVVFVIIIVALWPVFFPYLLHSEPRFLQA